MTFSQNARLVTMVTRANQAIRYEFEDGSIQRRHTYLDTQQVLPGRSLPAPLAATISSDLGMVALMQRGRPVSLWSLENDDLIGFCDRDAGTGDQPNISVQTALFNPNPNLSLLVVAYQDGDLILFDPEIQERLKSYSADALSLASTQDGRTLATGGSKGMVQIFDFESLELTYRINSYDVELKSLAFSRDGLRLVDIRDTRSKVWEPACLVRKLADEEISLSDMATLPVTVVGTRDDGLVGITAIAYYSSVPAIFVGKDDERVSVYDKSTGKQVSVLYFHGNNVISVVRNENGILASAGAGGRIIVCKL